MASSRGEPRRRAGVLACALLVVLVPSRPVRAADANAAGVLGLVHRLALKGDTAALERLLAGSQTGGIVEPTLRARVLAELGRYDESVAEYARALQSTAGEPDALFGWSEVELRCGQPAAARDRLSDVWRGSAAPPLKAEAVRRQLALVADDGAWDSIDWGAALGSIDDPDLAWRLLDALISEADAAGALFVVEQATSRSLGGESLGLGTALVLARIALATGDLDRASAYVGELERSLATRNGSVLALAGEVALARGRAGDAVRAFSEAHDLMPSWARMLERRARAARASGDLDTAQRDLRAVVQGAVDLATRDRAYLDWLAVLLERDRHADAARVYVEAVGNRGPEHRTALLEALLGQIADPKAALAAITATAVPPAGRGELRRLAAELAMRANDQNAALRELELAHDALPTDPEVLEQLAQAERRLGRLDQAIAHYREWTEREPRRAAPLTGWVATLRQAGDLDAALETGRRPSRERAADPDGWALTGTVLSLNGFGREGCDATRRAHELAPERAAYTFDLAVCLEDLDTGREAPAILESLLAAGSGGAPWQRSKVLERLRAAYTARGGASKLAPRVLAIADQPGTVDRAGLLLDAAELLRRSDELAAAAQLLERFVRTFATDSRWPAGALELAEIEMARARVDRARELWRAVIARPDLAADWGSRAALLLGDSLLVAARGEALAEWERCAVRHAAVAPGARCRLRRARALSEQGQSVAASAELVKLLANPARDLETTRSALDLLAGASRKGRP
ncbi:MAG: hypothetical protein U0610_32740 [bacterium]